MPLLRPLLRFRNSDSTRDLNQRLRRLVQKGVFWGGAVTAVTGQLRVRVAEFASMGSDGMVTVLESGSETLAVAAGNPSLVQYVVGRFIYRDNAVQTLTLEVLTAAQYAADLELVDLVTFAKVTVPLGATETLAAYIDQTVADRVDPMQRQVVRGSVATTGDLPADNNRSGDVYEVTADGSLWFWSGSAWARNQAQDPDYVTHAANDTTDLRHLTDQQYAALTSTPSGTALSRGNRFVDSASRLCAWTAYTVDVTDCYDIQLPGSWFVGKGVRSSGRMYFAALAAPPEAINDTPYLPDSLQRQLLGSDGLPIPILGIYPNYVNTPAFPGNQPTTLNPDGPHSGGWDGGNGFTFSVSETITSGSKSAVVTAQTGGGGAAGAIQYRLVSATDFVDNDVITGASSGKIATINGTPDFSVDSWLPVNPSADADAHGFVEAPIVRLNFDFCSDDGYTGRITILGLKECSLGGLAGTGTITCVAKNLLTDDNTQYFTLCDAANVPVYYQFDFGGGVQPGRTAIDISALAANASAALVAQAVVTAVNGVGDSYAEIDPGNSARVLLTMSVYDHLIENFFSDTIGGGFQVTGPTAGAAGLPTVGGGVPHAPVFYPAARMLPLASAGFVGLTSGASDVQTALDQVDVEIYKERLKWDEIAGDAVISGGAPSLPGGRTVVVGSGVALIGGRRVAFDSYSETPASWTATTHYLYLDPSSYAVTSGTSTPVGSVVFCSFLGHTTSDVDTLTDLRTVFAQLSGYMKLSKQDDALVITSTGTGTTKTWLVAGTAKVALDATTGAAQLLAPSGTATVAASMTEVTSAAGNVTLGAGAQSLKLETIYSAVPWDEDAINTHSFAPGETVAVDATIGEVGTGTVGTVMCLEQTGDTAATGTLTFVRLTGTATLSNNHYLKGMSNGKVARINGTPSSYATTSRLHGMHSAGAAITQLKDLRSHSLRASRLLWAGGSGTDPALTPIMDYDMFTPAGRGFDATNDNPHIVCGRFLEDYYQLDYITSGLRMGDLAFYIPLDIPRGVDIYDFKFYYHNMLAGAASAALKFSIHYRDSFSADGSPAGGDPVSVFGITDSKTLTSATTGTTGYFQIDPGASFQPNSTRMLYAVLSGNGAPTTDAGSTLWLKGCVARIGHKGFGNVDTVVDGAMPLVGI